MSGSQRIPSLDGLRAVSIALVVAGHLWAPLTALAAFGVHIFFVISGFLITSLLEHEYLTTGAINLRHFYWRRSFRIFPAAYAYIFIIAILCPAARGSLGYAATYTASYHVGNIDSRYVHLWSLSIEEQFYLLWPLVIAFCFRRRAVIALATIGACAGFRLWEALCHPFVRTALHYSPPGAMDSIAIGCLLAIYYPQVRKKLGWLAESGGMCLALAATAWILHLVTWSGAASAVYGCVPLLIALWIFVAVERSSPILNGHVAIFIGTLSYSIYLWQEPFLGGVLLPPVMALVCILGLAVVSYQFVERPALRISSRWASGQAHRCILRTSPRSGSSKQLGSEAG